VKVYLTVNTMPREYELPDLYTYLDSLADVGVDALIVSDLGVLSEARKRLPHIPLHISTQASSVNSLDINMWEKLGATRVVLARELSLAEIKEIRRNISPEMELEVFVHGSMCVSWSGRCLLSNYLTGRDSNRGMCAQPCRWNFSIHNLGIVEEKRPDITLPVEQHDGETFFMSSRDMCMVEHMAELLDAGISSFKIEGRMKSAYYTAVVTNAYRMARDLALRGEPVNPLLLREVESVSHRTYGTGYFFSDSHTDPNITEQSGYIREKAYLATVLSYDETTGEALCVQRNKYILGDGAELLTPGKVGQYVMPQALFDESHNPIPSTPHAGMKFYIKLPIPAKAGDILRGAEA
ncbi:MAG: U32 family peptidase C-terminal domain-containing protein, partial [Clostridia bacterium]|nr:U32 family peptidase C-terminal domain-containing protein [Clostridia bacterium]